MKTIEAEPFVELVHATQVRAQQAGLPAMTPDALLDELLALFKQADDYQPVQERLQYLLQSTQRWQVLLQEMLVQVQTLAVQREQRDRYSGKWWERQCSALHTLFQENPERGVQTWLRLFAEALLDWELDICLNLVAECFVMPTATATFSSTFLAGVQALVDGRPAEALDMLTHLAGDTPLNTAQPLDNILRAGLFVRIGHIHLYYRDQPAVARAQFNIAQALAPDDGRPYAAMGDYHRMQGDRDKAEPLYQQAIERSPERPEGYVGLGLLAEKRGWWDEAAEWYGQAVRRVRNARSVEVAVRQALGFTQAEGDYPERLRYQCQGMLAELFDQPEEAAEAYYQAGICYHWRQESLAAVTLLRKARALNPAHLPTYWQLSDALLAVSYRPTPPYVEEPLIRESVAVWEAGICLGAPDADHAWSYVSRALANEQLERLPDADSLTLWWQGVALFERALLLAETNGYAWAYLSRYHRNLDNNAVAIHAAEKAVEFAYNDTAKIAALGEKAAILANIGYLEEAAEAAAAYRELSPDDLWIKGVQGFVLAYSGHHAPSLEIFEDIVAAEPDNLWNREMRAFCYRMLAKIPEALKDYQWMWERHADPAYANQQRVFAWAAYYLFLLGQEDATFAERAVAICRALLDENPAPSSCQNLGVFYLAQGDIAQGQKHLLEGIQRSTSFRELDELRDVDLYSLRRFSAQWPHHDAIKACLDTTILPAVDAQRAHIEQPPTAIEELKRVLNTAKRADPTGGWIQIGAQAGLARLYTEEQRARLAGDAYRRLLPETERFPEAALGLRRVAESLCEVGDARFATKHTATALQQYKQAIALQAYSDDPTAQADLHSRLGLCHVDLGREAEARAAFVAALRLYAEVHPDDAGEYMGMACRDLLRDPAHYEKVDAAWEALERDPQTDSDLHAQYAQARSTLRDYSADIV